MSVSTVKPRCSSIARWLTLTALGYAVFATVSLWLPLGLHRIIMRRRDWWHFPASYIPLALGVVVWIATGRHALGVVAALSGGAWWFSILARDFFTMWTWSWPFQSSASEYLRALDQRLNLKANMSFLVVVAVLMSFLAHVA